MQPQPKSPAVTILDKARDISALAADVTTGARHPFHAFPHEGIPLVACGVYAIWDKEGRFLYAGMAGRALTGYTNHTCSGLYDRLRDHSRGRRSGDQFNLYVCDRLIIPTLTSSELLEVEQGVLKLDLRTRDLIRASLLYSYLVTERSVAYELERSLRRGTTAVGKPKFNPQG